MSVRDIDYNFVRYTEEHCYPYFSRGKMSVSEMFVALANGLLDPSSLTPMTIFEYDERLYCNNTRRLTIAKELQRSRKFDILERLPIQYITEDDEEFAELYRNLVNERLPAMEEKELDGSTIKLYRESEYMCCYDLTTEKFRDDLDEHIACDHVRMDISDFEKLNIFQCNRCHQERCITVIKPSNKASYKCIQNYVCRISGPVVLHTMETHWTEVSLREICHLLFQLKKDIEKESGTSASVPSMKRSSQSTVLLHGPKPVALNKNRTTAEVKKGNIDRCLKQFCLFLSRCFLVILLSWLMMIFLPKK